MKIKIAGGSTELQLSETAFGHEYNEAGPEPCREINQCHE